MYSDTSISQQLKDSPQLNPMHFLYDQPPGVDISLSSHFERLIGPQELKHLLELAFFRMLAMVSLILRISLGMF